jgi:hypothetical protein
MPQNPVRPGYGDTFRDDLPGFRGKSRDMRRHLDRMRDLLDNVMDYPTLDEELCWDEPRSLSTDEVQNLLLTEVGTDLAFGFFKLRFTGMTTDQALAHSSSRSTTRRARPVASSRSKILQAGKSIAAPAGPHPAPTWTRRSASSSTPFRCSNWTR